MNLFLVVMSVMAVVAKFPAGARMDVFHVDFSAAADVISLQDFVIGGRESSRGTN